MRFRTIRWMFLFFVIFKIFLLNCRTVSEPLNKPLIANAGPDQTTIVGSYAILDGSKSSGDINWYEWTQDENNPAKVTIFSGVDRHIQVVGFSKEGIYKFRLTVRSGVTGYNLSGTASSKPDEVIVTVNPNPYPTFEDPNLEIIVRFKLKKRLGELTEENLLSLYSLNSASLIPPEEISSLKGLEKCKNLQFLYMSLQNISDISPLATLTKLKGLGLDQNRKISDITPLANLTELEVLYLFSNSIENIEPLKNLTKLKILDIQWNDIKDISSLSKLKELTELRISAKGRPSIYDIKPLDIKPLEDLLKIKLLWIIGCNVKDISPLKNLVNIENLHLAWNQISDITPLSNMKKLKWVALDKNEISDISPLRDLSNLRYVRLWDNQIKNIKPLVENPGIGKGDIVGLDGNPLDEISLNEYIPELQARGVLVTW